MRMSVPWPLPLLAGVATAVGGVADVTHTHHLRGVVLLVFSVVLLTVSVVIYRTEH
jgi:Na+/pantothenate symporter